RGGHEVMAMTKKREKTLSRRTFVKGSGSMIVGFSLAGAVPAGALAKAGSVAVTGGRRSWPLPALDQVDSFLEIRADGSVLAKFGKGTASQGTITGVVQMYAEELDVPFESITPLVGDTARVPDQRGASGSDGTATEWTVIRQVAATARQALLA